MSEMISALLKRPGEIPRHVNVSNSLEALQKNVEGYVECVTLAEDLAVLCNEDGKYLKMPYNCTICGERFVGPILMVGMKAGEDGVEFADLPVDWKTMKKLFPDLWRENNGKRA